MKAPFLGPLMAVSTKRLSLTRHGQVRYELNTPYSNGTIHFLFDPLDFLSRLAAFVSKHKVNLTIFLHPTASLQSGKPTRAHGGQGSWFFTACRGCHPGP